jgi:hypothetical protein
VLTAAQKQELKQSLEAALASLKKTGRTNGADAREP